jgi:DNA-binding transcriptional LysR family regulator
VSWIVAALETQIGVALFVRTTRALTLTEAGSDYLSRIELMTWQARQDLAEAAWKA